MISRIVTVFILIFILTTGIAHANVRITEIAWMGTKESQFAEWFELFNDASAPVNLSGWKLYKDAGAQLVFTFSKTIPENGYLLVERVTPSSPDPVPGINDESGPFGGSGLSNSGENLVLKDEQGSLIQSLDFASGWPAGDSTTKQTMQWDGTKWVTADATPKGPLQTNGSGGNVGSSSLTSGSSWTPPKIEPRIEFSIPRTVYSMISSDYEAKTFLEYGEAYSGVFLWNMGDGNIYKSDKPTTISHTYKYPGSYTISFAYYKNSYDKKPFLFDSVEKNVISPKIIFSVISGKGFQFTNTDTNPIDISDWSIVLSDKVVTLPPFSIIGSNKTILMPFSSFGLNTSYTKATLQTPDRVNISEAQKEQVSQKFNPVAINNISDKKLSSSELIASAETSLGTSNISQTKKSPIKPIIFGGALLVVVGLFIFIERLVGRQG